MRAAPIAPVRSSPVRSPRSPASASRPTYPDYSPVSVAPSSVDLPVTVPGGTRATLTVELRRPGVPRSDSSLPPFDLVLTYRTQSGRHRPPHGADDRRAAARALPRPAADRTAAGRPGRRRGRGARRREPRLRPERPAPARLDAIDDPRGLTEADAELRAGPYAATAATTTATIGDVCFDRPDHAWFRYELSSRRRAPAPARPSSSTAGGRWPAPPCAPTSRWPT